MEWRLSSLSCYTGYMDSPANIWNDTKDIQFRRAIEDWTRTTYIASAASAVFEDEVGLTNLPHEYYVEETTPFDSVIRFAVELRGPAVERARELVDSDASDASMLISAVREFESLLGGQPGGLAASCVALTNVVGLHVFQQLRLRQFQLSPRMRESIITEFAGWMPDTPDHSLGAGIPREFQNAAAAKDLYRSLLVTDGIAHQL